MIRQTSEIVKAELAKGKTVRQIQEERVLKKWDDWGTGFINTNRWIRSIANGLNPPVIKQSIAVPLYYTIKKKGVDAAIKQYKQLKKEKPEVYDFREFNLNSLGYSFLFKNRFDEAIKIFKLNIQMFPESANVYDSLGEAYEKSDNYKLAVENYSKAVQNAEKLNDPNLNIFKSNLQRVRDE